MSRPDPPAPARLFAPAAQRNRDPILDVLRRVLPAAGTVLEIASGTGEHAVHFAARLPGLAFQPSDPDPRHRESIAAWAAEAALPNLRPPLALDVTAAEWWSHPELPRPVGALLCINMIHISPWAATLGLVHGAGRLLAPGAVLYLYGPYRRAGRHTAPSNDAFDRSLRMQDRAWGVRDLEDVVAAAEAQGFAHAETVPMPANNLSVVFRKPAE